MTTYIRGSDNFDTAQVSTAEMQAGTSTASVAMSPAKVKDAITSNGKVVQIVYGSIGAASGWTTIPDDNTTPTNAEGTQIVSKAITPTSASNKVRVSAYFTGLATYASSTSHGKLIAALFRDSTCIATARIAAGATANEITESDVMNFDFIDAPATTSSTTYSIRVGLGGGQNWYVNRSSESGTALNNTLNSHIILQEVVAT